MPYKDKKVAREKAAERMRKMRLKGVTKKKGKQDKTPEILHPITLVTPKILRLKYYTQDITVYYTQGAGGLCWGY